MISIGEALVDALLLGIKGHPRARRAVEWVGEVGRPPVGVRLVADDGAEYTGVVVVDANKPRLMFAIRGGKDASAAVGEPTTADKRRPTTTPEGHGHDGGAWYGDVTSYE